MLMVEEADEEEDDPDVEGDGDMDARVPDGRMLVGDSRAGVVVADRDDGPFGGSGESFGEDAMILAKGIFRFGGEDG